ncbi:hypothetical protein ACEUZ9_000904 [Paracoccus litorisediminis]|uniref:hypothetical protein n=1 Tax=Paracoccus litorisediminis TaxID=2006130 RepID=UPI00373233B2
MQKHAESTADLNIHKDGEVVGFLAERDFTKEVITPQIAEEMLATALDPHVDDRAVDTYAKVMETDSWAMNGQPIIFDEEGRLLDGVQRLKACIQAGRPFTTFVARNIRSDILHTIDQHRRRNYLGVLQARGIDEAGAIHRTMAKLIRIENGVLGREQISISWSRFDRVLAANPELEAAVKLSNKYSKSTLHSKVRPVLCFMAIRAGHADKMENFLQQLTYHHTEGLDSPARMFGIQLSMWSQNAQDNRRAGRTGAGQNVDSVLGHAILHFNAYLRGEKLSKPLAWQPDFGMRKVTRVLNGEEVSDKVAGTEFDYDKNAAPSNLGLPVMTDYPGLREGHFDKTRVDDFVGETADLVHQGAVRGAGDAYITMLTVTPEMAQKWLSPQINRHNRKTQRNHVNAIARDIKAGNWMFNAQPICFTKDPTRDYESGDEPRLLNGQHRLLAIRDAETPIEIPIAVNIPEESFPTFDIHAKRTVRKAGPKADDRVLIAAARFQFKEDNNIPLSSSDMPTLTASELLQVLEEHPGLADNFAQSRRAGMQELGSAGVMTYFIYRVKRESPVLAEEFLQKIETGLNLTDSSDPAGKLRRELAKTSVGPRSRTRKEQIEALISHWNSYKQWAKRGQKANAAKAEEKSASAETRTEVQDELF